MTLQGIGQLNLQSDLKESLVKVSHEEDVNGDGKKDFIIKVETSPHRDNAKHYITYVDLNGDGKYDYKINETVNNFVDQNGNKAPATKQVYQASDKEDRSMFNLLQKLTKPEKIEKGEGLDICW